MGQSIDIRNIGTISGMTVNQILSAMVRKKIGIDLGSTGVYVPSYDYVTGAIALGSVVTMSGYEWIVCHLDYSGAAVYLMTKDVISTTQFGSSNTYSGSTAASVAKTFENGLDSTVRENLLTRNVLGVTQKVQLPTYEEMNGGFTYFSDNNKRVAYLNGAAQAYWTASPGGGGRVSCVNAGGNMGATTATLTIRMGSVLASLYLCNHAETRSIASNSLAKKRRVEVMIKITLRKISGG